MNAGGRASSSSPSCAIQDSIAKNQSTSDVRAADARCPFPTSLKGIFSQKERKKKSPEAWERSLRRTRKRNWLSTLYLLNLITRRRYTYRKAQKRRTRAQKESSQHLVITNGKEKGKQRNKEEEEGVSRIKFVGSFSETCNALVKRN